MLADLLSDEVLDQSIYDRVKGVQASKVFFGTIFRGFHL